MTLTIPLFIPCNFFPLRAKLKQILRKGDG